MSTVTLYNYLEGDQNLVALMDGTIHRYGCVWNQTDASMTRIWDAKDITTDTTNFTNNGSVNENYNNPFDDLMPWKGRKVCNVNLETYKAMIDAGSGSLTDCIVAFEGDAEFNWNHADGVWVYTPAFWYADYEREDGCRVFGIADGPVPGWMYAPESIQSRIFGVDEVRTVDEQEVHYLLPKAGSPLVYISGVTQHAYANNYGGTLEDIYTLSEENILYVVEFANMNSQAKLGNGVSDLHKWADHFVQADADDTNTVTILTSDASGLVPEELFHLSSTAYNTPNLAVARKVVSVDIDANDATLTHVTFDGEPVSVTTSTHWSAYGLANPTDLDSAMGSRSGYIGVNAKSNAYYRGKVSHANLWRYILGCFHSNNNELWLAKRKDCDAYDARNASVHINTNIELPASSYAKSLVMIDGIGLAPVASETGGTSAKPVADYWYNENPTSNTVLRVGGSAYYGLGDGRFYGSVLRPAGFLFVAYAALSILKNP